jgi:hypothetical protein
MRVAIYRNLNRSRDSHSWTIAEAKSRRDGTPAQSVGRVLEYVDGGTVTLRDVVCVVNATTLRRMRDGATDGREISAREVYAWMVGIIADWPRFDLQAPSNLVKTTAKREKLWKVSINPHVADRAEAFATKSTRNPSVEPRLRPGAVLPRVEFDGTGAWSVANT